MTISPIPWPPLTAENVFVVIPIQVTSDKQIEKTVSVVVEERCTCAPTTRRDTGFRRHICKRAVSVVVIEHVMRETSDINIRKTVVIIVSDGYAHAIDPAVGNAGLLSDVGKRAVWILPVECIVACRAFHGEFVASTLHQENVQTTVTVVVKKSSTTSHRFDKKFVIGRPIHVMPGYA